jgi:hypothetical protein
MAGRRIDDHSFWAGAKSAGTVFPGGPHKVKMERSAEGAGHVGTDYSDTTERIREDQMHAEGKVKSHKMKTGYRY